MPLMLHAHVSVPGRSPLQILSTACVEHNRHVHPVSITHDLSDSRRLEPSILQTLMHHRTCACSTNLHSIQQVL